MKWESVIGLEVHVELATESKIFCSCSTAFGGAPNSHCCPVCTGMPGTLPALNGRVLDQAIAAGLALGCKIRRHNAFDRKNYFYPDLPKAYQISQLYLPFAYDGAVKLSSGDVRITEVHMEEDAGKLIHCEGGRTLLDFNRCGVPLIEIVTAPDFKSAEQVSEFLNRIRSMFTYMGISDMKMQEGSMRVDVNLSVNRTGEGLGVRTEMKNLNSLRAIERAIAHESEWQIAVLEAGGAVEQQTRRWDEDAGVSVPMRTKEDARDYRYFPEPDIPPVHISEEKIAEIAARIPEFAHERAKRFEEQYSLSAADGRVIAEDRGMADCFESAALRGASVKELRYLLVGEARYHMSCRGVCFADLGIDPASLAHLADLIARGGINRTGAKKVFEAMCGGSAPFDIDGYISAHDLAQTEDTALITEAVRAVLAENPHSVAQYKAGKTKVAGFFVGGVMKRLSGKAKPETVNEIVIKELSKI